MNSAHVLTSSILRQFAVQDGDSIEVSTKLGPHTLVRASFDLAEFPSDAELQASFLKDLIARASPDALGILSANATKCLEDQAKAVRRVIQVIKDSSAN